MKPDSNLYWRLSFRVFITAIALGLAALAADATAGVRSTDALESVAADASATGRAVAGLEPHVTQWRQFSVAVRTAGR